MPTTIDHSTETDRDREIAHARAELLHRARVRGVKPIATIKDLAGDPEMIADFDVDEFLRQVREDRERSSTPSME
jgi:citrate lyase beta subunit